MNRVSAVKNHRIGYFNVIRDVQIADDNVDLTATEVIRLMGNGINLGNTSQKAMWIRGLILD